MFGTYSAFQVSEVHRYPTSPRSRVSCLDTLYFINLKYAVSVRGGCRETLFITVRLSARGEAYHLPPSTFTIYIIFKTNWYYPSMLRLFSLPNVAKESELIERVLGYFFLTNLLKIHDSCTNPNCRVGCNAPYAITRVLRRILRKS